MTQSFKPEGIGENIFSQRYAINSRETWAEACMRVASHVSNAEVTFQLKEEYKKKFYDDLLSNKFMPGGRIWYGSKRKKGGLINCFVIKPEDSRESWGQVTSDMLVISGLGGGVGMNFCMAPHSRVLNQDFKWIRIDKLQEGDKIIGLDEETESITGRCLRSSVVEKIESIVLPSVKILTEKGEMIVSETHPILARKIRNNYKKKGYGFKWVMAKDLTKDYELAYACDPWDACDDIDFNWLGGVLDGEGCLSKPKTNERNFNARLSIGQNAGKVFDKINEVLNKLKIDFDVRKNSSNNCYQFTMATKWDAMKVLAYCSTTRISEKKEDIWNGGRIYGKYRNHVKIKSVDFINNAELIAIQTSSKTYIAEGFFQHNSAVRPKGEKIKGVGGEASGPISLMKIINNVGEEIKTGGGRRVALMFCLNIDHPDILDFLQCKYSKKAESDADFMNEWNSHFVRASHDPQYLDSLNKMLSKEESKDFVGKIFKLLNDKKIQNANVSVVIPEGQFEKFSDAVKNDKDWQLKWKGKVKKTIKARELWKTLVDNAYESAEPGILNFDLAERMSNLSYYAKISSTNPCLAKDTMVTTKKGLFPIQDLIGKEVEIWDGDQWVMVDNFRVTGENREMLKIELQDGSILRATPNHNFILSDGSIKKASELNIDDELKTSDIPQAHGDIEVKGAYLKGFILGDGFYSGNDVILPLYNSKWNCKERLLQSGLEILTDKNYNGIAKDLGFAEPTNSAPNRVMMQGLNLRKSELKEFGLEYKKRLPKEIYQWNYKSKIEFIAGLFDSDGTAIDNSNGFGYQFLSIHLDFIRDLQLLLKTIGIKSKIDCSKKAEMKDFNDGYGEYQTKDCFRLSIAQRYSIVLADQVNFNRLTNLKNKPIKYSVKLNHNRIKSISEDGIDEKVYCCTVSTNNRFSCNYMILLGNCGEICMQPNSVCCLGSLVLPRFHNKETGFFDFEGLSATIKNAVRFLDNVLEINKYPTKETKKEAKKTRRIGLGIMGLHDLLLMRGLKYSSSEGLSFVSRLMSLIKNDAYNASIELAKEKGSFAVFNFEGYSKSEFFRSLDSDLQKEIEKNGIRNCAILSIAPTGTISMVCGVTSGIEPIFAYAYKRKYFKGDNLEVENVIHPLYRECIESGKSVDHFQSSYDLTVKDHLEIQKVCQAHVDQAISKTINVPANYPKEELYTLFLDYLPYLKGLTIYVDGSRGGAPLESMSYEEASQVISCPKGVCEIG